MIDAADLKRLRKLNAMYTMHSNSRCTLFWRVMQMGYPQFVDDNHQVKRAAVGMKDGRLLYYWNRTFFDKLSLPETGFVAAHETMHVILDHCQRRGNRDPKQWNHACDILDNEMLLNDYGGIFGFVPSENGNLNDIIRAAMYNINPYLAVRMTVEELYDKITERKQQQQDADNGMADVETDSINGVPNDESVRGRDDRNPDGRSHADNAQPVDQHDAWEEELTDELTRDIIRRAVEEIYREDAEKAKQSRGGRSKRQRGMQYGFGTKGEFAWLIEKFIQPFPWQQLLRQRLASVRKPNEGDNWSRCHRKMYSVYPNFMLPGLHENEQLTSSILFTIDTSGSMSEDNIADMVAIGRSLPQEEYEVNFTWFDNAVWQAKDLSQARGRGGTSFQRIEAVACGDDVINGETVTDDIRLERYPDVVIVMTDGIAPRPTVKFPERWIFIIAPHGNANTIKNLGATIWQL